MASVYRLTKSLILHAKVICTMRLFEWLLLLSFIPALLVPFLPPKLRHRRMIGFALLPAVVVGLHLLVEGWRVQMLPAYLLALLVLLTGLLTLMKPRLATWRWRGRLLSLVAALGLVGCAVGAGWLLPIIRLPVPTGAYAVGVVDRELVDQERGRRLMVSVWYPAAQQSSPAPLTHYPEAIASGLGNLSGLPDLGFQHLRYAAVAASEGVPVAEASVAFPVLVFSHGMVGLRLQNSSTLQELASWGYVVVALDHTDAAAVTVFPDGEERFYDLERFGVPSGVEVNQAMMDEYVFPVWVGDQRFVYDTLESWSADDPLFAGRLDMERVGSFGHSFGGATALEVCRVEPRCRAAANLDGALYGDLFTLPSVRPLLLMTSAESRQFDESVAEWTWLIDHADAPAYWLELPGSNHFSFTITQLLSPLLAPAGYDPREGLHVIDKYLRAFFDAYLRGEGEFPQAGASGTPEVNWLAG